ncbi:hypothetical protein [Streptomyces sp. NBC_00078]|nr:hypothetical protein [Streptomyces sp. NBC_00078]MCX5418849.1 hypothetical protein [Streptomyces sp. NBC_00078]
MAQGERLLQRGPGVTSTPLMTRWWISPSMVVSTISTPRITT